MTHFSPLWEPVSAHVLWKSTRHSLINVHRVLTPHRLRFRSHADGPFQVEPIQGHWRNESVEMSVRTNRKKASKRSGRTQKSKSIYPKYQSKLTEVTEQRAGLSIWSTCSVEAPGAFTLLQRTFFFSFLFALMKSLKYIISIIIVKIFCLTTKYARPFKHRGVFFVLPYFLHAIFPSTGTKTQKQ